MTAVRARRQLTLVVVWVAIATLVPAGLANLLFVHAITPDSPAIAFVLFTAVVVMFGGVGAIVITRQPDNRIGWILWVVGALTGINLASNAYATWSLAVFGGTLPGTVPAAWISQWAFSPPFVIALYLLPLLFPDGHLPSRRWRWALVSAVATVVLSGLSDMLQPGQLGSSALPNPTGWTGDPRVLSALTMFSQLSPLLALPVVLAASVTRYRRGTTIERQQLKWFGTVAALSVISLSIAVTTSDPLAIAAFIVAVASLGLVPVAIGMAILRYRLFEIDRIISRTISWAATTGIILAVFGAIVIGLQDALARVIGGNTVAVAGSTLIVATVFQPLRRRVQTLVDRRFNRSRYDATVIASAFATSLRGETDLAAIDHRVVDTVMRSLRPARAGIWTRRAGS